MIRLGQYNAFFLAIVCFLIGCDSSFDPDEQAEIDEKKILEYIEEHDLDAERHSSGLYYVIEKEGSGNHPTAENSVKLNYLAKFIDGEVFSQEQGAIFYLPNRIEGLQIGIPLYKRGGEGILLIPSALAHGGYHNPYYDINRVIIYEIEIIDF